MNHIFNIFESFFEYIKKNIWNMFNILLEKSDLNLQDINGNNIIHYIIIERNYHFLNQNPWVLLHNNKNVNLL